MKKLDQLYLQALTAKPTEEYPTAKDRVEYVAEFLDKWARTLPAQKQFALELAGLIDQQEDETDRTAALAFVQALKDGLQNCFFSCKG